MQHFRESIMSLKKCDVFVDKRRKSDLHFLDLFPKYRARWAGARNLEFPKVQSIIISIRLSHLWKEEMSLAVWSSRSRKMYKCHVCRSCLKNWSELFILPFSRSANKPNRTRLRPFDSGWSFLDLIAWKTGQKPWRPFASPPCRCFWRKCRRHCVVFFNRTMSYLMWFAFLPLYRKRTLIYHPSSLKFWQTKITLHPGIAGKTSACSV